MSSRTTDALNRFQGGFNCAQSVLACFAQDQGLDAPTALRVSCAFGAGMGRLQETCGAVTGACMVLGLRHGKVMPDDDAAKERTYRLVLEFDRRFRDRFSATRCRELLGCDLRTDAGRQDFKDRELSRTRCSAFVTGSVEILEEILRGDT